MDQCDEGVIVLEERPSEEFEPTEEEIRDYAGLLGMDPDADADLLYIAREGLQAPLEGGWKPCQNSSGEIFYFNFETGEGSWEHPADDSYKKKVQEAKQLKRDSGAGKIPVMSRGYSLNTTGRQPCALLRRACCCKRRRQALPL